MSHLSSWIWSGAGLTSVTDDHFVDFIGRNTRALERGACRDRAKLRWMHILQ
jgi:hypothetical protein